MGHLIPMVNIADILTQGGHECYFITNGNEYTREKAPLFLDKVGVKEIIYTMDEVGRDYITLNSKDKND